MANRYSKALKHIRGKKNLSEAPTNSLSGVYALNKPGTRLAAPPHDGRIFLPDIDGNYPPGIPGTPGSPFYVRGDGYWSGEVDWDTITTPNFSHDDAGSGGTSTESLIDDATGVVLTGLPPNSRHFILGPLVDGHTYLHGYDAYSNIGYIQKDTRQFVLLARVDGQWVPGGYPIPTGYEHYGWGESRVWGGTSTGFTSYNPEFTLEMAQWFQQEMAANRYVKNVAYFYSGGVSQPPISGGPAAGMYGGSGVGAGGNGGDASDPSGENVGAGYGSGGEPNIGTAENETPGGPEEAGFPWGLGQLWDDLKDKGGELINNLTDWAGDTIDDVGEFLGDVFDNAADIAEGAADIVDSLGEAITDAVENVGGAVSDAVSNSIGALADAYGAVYDSVTGQGSTNGISWTDIANNSNNLGDSYGDFFGPAADAYLPDGSGFSDTYNWFGNDVGYEIPDYEHGPGGKNPLEDPGVITGPEGEGGKDDGEGGRGGGIGGFFNDLTQTGGTQGIIAGIFNRASKVIGDNLLGQAMNSDWMIKGMKGFSFDTFEFSKEAFASFAGSGPRQGVGNVFDRLAGNLFKGRKLAAFADDLVKGIFNPNLNFDPKFFKKLAGKNYVGQYFADGNAIKQAAAYAQDGVIVATEKIQSAAGWKNWFGGAFSRSVKGEPEIFARGADIMKNQVFKVFDAADPKSIAELKKLVSSGAKNSKWLGKAGRAVPFVGAIASAYDAYERFKAGDEMGGVLSVVSMMPGPVGWWALGLQVAYDVEGAVNKDGIKSQFVDNDLVGDTVGYYQNMLGGGIGEGYLLEGANKNNNQVIPDAAKQGMYESLMEKGVPLDDPEEYAKQFAVVMIESGINPELMHIILSAVKGEKSPEEDRESRMASMMGLAMNLVVMRKKAEAGQDLNPYTNPFPKEDEPWGNLEVQKETKIRSVRSVIREQAAQAPTVDASSSPGEVNSSIIKNATNNFAKDYVKNHGVEKAQELKDKTEGFMQEQDIPTNEERASQPQIQEPESNTDEDVWDRLGDIAKEFWKRTNYASLDAKGAGVILDQTQWFVTNIIDFTQRHVVDGVYEEIFGDDLIKTASKLSNNISIARSIMSGKVIEHKPIITEVNKFKESLTVDNFSTIVNGQKKLRISTSPVPYVDDNIYIDENGNTHVNHGEYAPLANIQWGFGPMHDDGIEGSLAGSGKGYAQMVVPTDGSEPYVLFEDYNYHNLNSKDEVEVPNPASEILSALSHLIGESGFSSLLTHVFVGHLTNAANNYNKVFDSLKDKQGLPGWPKGIHGAAHTKFQVPLSQLPKDTQDMIKNHPLLWSKERVAALTKEEREALYENPDSFYYPDFKDPKVEAYYTEAFDRIMKDHPELQDAWDGNRRIYDERRELIKKRKEGNDPEIQLKIDAAYKALQDAQWGEDGVRWSSLPEEEQFKKAGVSHKEYTKLKEKVQGYRHGYEYANDQIEYKEAIAETDRLTQLYTTYNQIQQNAYAPIKGMNDALGVVNGQLKGTDQQMEQYKQLVADYHKAYEEMMVHFRARQSKMMETSRLHQTLRSDFDNTWKQASGMFNNVQSILKGKIDELRRIWEVAKTNGIDGINKKIKELDEEIKRRRVEQEPLYKAFDDHWTHDWINWKFKYTHPDVDVDPWTNPRMAPSSVDDGYGGSGPAAPAAKTTASTEDEPVQDDPTYGGADAATAAVMAGARKKRYEEYKKQYESELLEEYKLHILKEIKKPVEVCEVPFQKLRKYKPNFVGKFTPQNVPSATASHQSDKLIDKANARGQTWRSENRYWQGYETVERMNLIQDRLGHGNQAWEKIIDEARNKNGWKNREIQEHLNVIAHTKAMKDINPDYESPFTYLQLQEMGNAEPSKDPIGDEKRENELGTYLKDPLVKRVAKKVKSTLDYKDKPAKKGYPDKEPPKMEKGMHPQFGKGKEGYYSKLDPQSANAMPVQGDDVIDKKVEKAKTEPELDTIPFRDSLFKKLSTLRDKQKKELTKN